MKIQPPSNNKTPITPKSSEPLDNKKSPKNKHTINIIKHLAQAFIQGASLQKTKKHAFSEKIPKNASKASKCFVQIHKK